MESNNRIQWIDFAKAVAIIFVIMGHAIGEYSLQLKELELIIYSVHIPLFFILSGYTFKVKYDTKNWIIKRTKKILLPYILFCFCITTCHIIEKKILNQDNNFWEKLSTKSGFLNTVFITPKSAFSNLWFLPCLLLSEIILYSILKYIKNNNIQRILCLLPGFIILLFKIRIILPFSLCTVMVSLMYIYLGYIINKYTILNNKLVIVSMMLYISVIIYDIIILKCNLEQTMFDLNITYPILFLITSILGSILIIEICKRANYNRIINEIGLNTLYIYGFHFIAQNIIKILLYKFNFLTRYNLIFLIISTILNLIICFIGIQLLTIIKKIINKIIKLKGEKKDVRKKT